MKSSSARGRALGALGAVLLSCGCASGTGGGAASGGAAAASTQAIALSNPGFESPGPSGTIEGWTAVQHAGRASYAFALDAEVRHAGERSARIANIGPEPYGSLYQPIPAAPYRGKTLRFSAWLRTRDATGNVFGAGAGLTLLAKSGGYVLSDAQMKADAVRGTTGWARRAVELQVPADAERIEAGFTLFGPGTAWFDDAALEVLAP